MAALVPAPVDFKYRAFLSYAHADVAWGRWLHSQLEMFRIDKDLVGRATPRGPVPKSLRPIFRDREDFSGGHSLTDATIAALDASAALIVLCSTVAATRPTVNEEIRLFRHRHPDRPVVPVVIDGTFPENFPPALRFDVELDGSVSNRPVTILGPDLRNDADGRILGIAKIVAGLTGLETDVVYRRAEQARLRRLKQISAGLACILLIVGALGTWAEVQRSRFSNYLALATKFDAFGVADETGGWQPAIETGRDTLLAAQRAVSQVRGFGGLRILWFDDEPKLSEAAKDAFRDGMRGLGIVIREEHEIDEAKAALLDRWDVVVANFGGPQERFAYYLLAELNRLNRPTPLVIYGLDGNPTYAREAMCHGAFARATQLGTLYSAVIRAIGTPRPPATHAMIEIKCIREAIKPYDTPAWKAWANEQSAGRTTERPQLNWR